MIIIVISYNVNECNKFKDSIDKNADDNNDYKNNYNYHDNDIMILALDAFLYSKVWF